MARDTVVGEFERLAEPYADRSLREEIVETVASPEGIRVADLVGLLAKVRTPTM